MTSFILTGGVRLTDWRGFELTSPTMNIDFRTEIATTQSKVEAAQGDSWIAAGGMRANAPEETLYFSTARPPPISPLKNNAQDKTQGSPSPNTQQAGFKTDPSAPIITRAQDLSLNQKPCWRFIKVQCRNCARTNDSAQPRGLRSHLMTKKNCKPCALNNKSSCATAMAP